jgi:hypothetical protein
MYAVLRTSEGRKFKVFAASVSSPGCGRTGSVAKAGRVATIDREVAKDSRRGAAGTTADAALRTHPAASSASPAEFIRLALDEHDERARPACPRPSLFSPIYDRIYRNSIDLSRRLTAAADIGVATAVMALSI